MLLWAGYHRSYARMARAVPEAMVRSALMVLTTDGTLDTSPGAPDQGLRAIICGDAPPLFADFLDDRLVMKVKYTPIPASLRFWWVQWTPQRSMWLFFPCPKIRRLP